MPPVTIRPMTEADVEAVSRLILRALREVNARDYPPEEIEETAANFSPDQVRARMLARRVLVADEAGKVLGTASLGKDHVNAVFVVPDRMGEGIGRRLLAAVEDLAREERRQVLRVNSSVYAVRFYERLGYGFDPEPPFVARGVTPMVKQFG